MDVYDGMIPKGMDFISVFKGVLKLIKGNITKYDFVRIEFQDFISNKSDQTFFTKALKLKPEEIIIRLEFCDTNTKSETILKDENIL